MTHYVCNLDQWLYACNQSIVSADAACNKTYNFCYFIYSPVIGSDGEELKIHNISRYCEDVYECEAVNDIGPPASREMKVTVECKYISRA